MSPPRGLCLVAIVVTLVACSPGGSRTPSTPDGSRTGATVAAPSANRIVFWTNCTALMQTSQAELVQWKQRGVGGFVCQTGFLAGFGGSVAFTANPKASLAAPEYGLQNALRGTHFVQRAAALGMKVYLGFY